MHRLAVTAQPRRALRSHAAAAAAAGRQLSAARFAITVRCCRQALPTVSPCTRSIHSHRSPLDRPPAVAHHVRSATTAATSLPPVPFFSHFNSPDFLHRTAVTIGGASEQSKEDHTYEQLLRSARRIAGLLQTRAGSADLRGRTVCLLHSDGFHYSSSLLGIWLVGAIAVPLHPSHAKPELEYLIADARTQVVLYSAEHQQLVRGLTVSPEIDLLPVPKSTDDDGEGEMQQVQSYGSKEEFAQRQAMLIYTSGTTGKPKGVEWTHLMLETQMRTLCTAWRWTSQDHILHVLPLHHVHGVVNVLLCALCSGARVTWLKGKQGAEEIIREFMHEQNTLTVYMAVPTIYSRVLTALAKMSREDQQRFKQQAQKLRLMVSGSAALPASVLAAWQGATGHLLLERYGMSECGMILSQSIDSEKRQSIQQGTVGEPMDSVEIKIVPKQNEQGGGAEEEKWHHDAPSSDPSKSSSSSGNPSTGELLVRGPSVFRSYWHAPEKTKAEITADGWFRTGDIVSRDSRTHQIRILGRSSVDILKSGGYKISAIDVERELLKLEGIAEVAVVGVPSREYGQIVSAVIALQPGSSLTSKDITAYAKERLAKYQVPRHIRIVDSLPKNAMGKINKKQLVKLFDEEQ